MYVRPLLRGALILAVITTLAGAAIGSGVLRRIQRPVSDALIRIGGAWPPAPPEQLPDVTVVVIDPKSLRAHPGWPWPRRLYARALSRLDAAGARAIGFDIDFSTNADPVDDAAFGAEIARSGRVVLAAFRQVERLAGGAELEVVNVPIPELAHGAAAVGSLSVPIDSDGVVRSARRSTPLTGRLTPGFAVSMIEVALGPTSHSGRFDLDYRRARPPFPTISFGDLLEGRFDPRDVEGRLVMVGATAAEFQDQWTTPLSPATPGVYIQAVALRTLLAERAGQRVLQAAGAGAQTGLAALVSLLAFALATAAGQRRGSGLLGLSVGVAALPVLAAIGVGILIDPVVPLLVVAAHYATGLEALRKYFSSRLEAQNLSLQLFTNIGRAGRVSSDTQGIEMAVEMLGQIIEAEGVALMHCNRHGELAGTAFQWHREKREPIGDPDIALRVADEGKIRIVEAPRVHIYVPLFAGDRALSVLVVQRQTARPPDENEMRTIVAVVGLMALSLQNLQLVRRLRRAKHEAEEANRAKTAFLANMSHEVRTPLNAVIGYTELVLDDEPTLSEDARSNLAVVRRNGSHLLELLNDILDISRIEAGQLSIERVPMDPRELAEEVAALFRPRAEERGLALGIAFGPAIPPCVSCDPTRLRQVLVNLIGNAVKFTHEGSVDVSMSYQPDAEQLVIVVRDTGIGIPEDKRAALFHSFEQVDSSVTRAYGGTGLGLAITARLAELLEGAIWVESRVDEGSTFTFTCTAPPVTETASETEDAPREAIDRLDARILLAEDGLDNQRLLAAMLRQAGAEIVVVENGRLALEAVARQRFDVVLMDMAMPELDGYEATRLLRDAGEDLPIIALTAHAMAGDRERCLAAGCNDYLTKPLERGQLLEAIHAQLDKPEQTATD